MRDTDGVAAEGAFSYSMVTLVGIGIPTNLPDSFERHSWSQNGEVHVLSPRKSHDEAFIRIGLYLKLKGTRDKGLVLTHPNSSVLNVEAFSDADFGGLYG